ncbi:MAG: 16S rRNA (cytidine(1402)-2'-O)-methyltransferase [Candidatus Competibacteraceae bacterium]|jgi:16S rRNA (cytidine1402-2'-O)-methyltransferase|nr:16S rRNA (cytidine(1402)-2'-O)-methyltransferase [Candidatus Competibacteraceae bacterium]
MIIEPGVLYVVATPIGNLSDISARALQVLREVAWIAAEDTRHSKRLLHHFGIHTPLISLHDHNEQARIPQLLADLETGKAIALISDAGTPLISDPGFPLLRQISAAGMKASPIPGPSSLVAALSVAGLPTDRFVFEGFLPAKPQARCNYLSALQRESRTLVFFESSHRIQATLTDMATIFGTERQATLARELTKQFEEIHPGKLGTLCDWLNADANRCRGEFVIVVQGSAQAPDEWVRVEIPPLLSLLLKEMPVKRAVAVAGQLSGWPKNKLYELALKLKDQAVASESGKEDTGH